MWGNISYQLPYYTMQVIWDSLLSKKLKVWICGVHAMTFKTNINIKDEDEHFFVQWETENKDFWGEGGCWHHFFILAFLRV